MAYHLPINSYDSIFIINEYDLMFSIWILNTTKLWAVPILYENNKYVNWLEVNCQSDICPSHKFCQSYHCKRLLLLIFSQLWMFLVPNHFFTLTNEFTIIFVLLPWVFVTESCVLFYCLAGRRQAGLQQK